jgi:hypothetical protein
MKASHAAAEQNFGKFEENAKLGSELVPSEGLTSTARSGRTTVPRCIFFEVNEEKQGSPFSLLLISFSSGALPLSCCALIGDQDLN